MAKLYGNIASSALMTFDKSFARANGQPLDSTEVYYSLAAAQEYAAGAGAYVGQKIVVIEEGVVTHYSIEDAEGTLKELGSKPVGDGTTISIAEDGKISLANVADKAEGTYNAVLINGVLNWVKPSETTVEGLSDLIQALTGRVDGHDTAIAENKKAIEDEAAAARAAEKALGERIDAIDFVDETEMADAIEAARELISKEIDDDVEIAKDRADEAYTLAETKVDAEAYAADKKELEDEDAAIREIAEAAKERIDTFLDEQGVADVVDSLHDLKAELDKMADATEMVEALAAKADVTYVDEELAKKQDVIPENTYDAYGSAAAAKSEAIADAEGKIATAKQEAIDAAADAAADLYATQARVNDLETALDGRLDVLEAIDHTAYTTNEVFNEYKTTVENTYATKEDLAPVKQTADNAAAKVETLEDKIEEITSVGGEPNVIDYVKVNGTILEVEKDAEGKSTKTVNVIVPTKFTDITDDSGFGTRLTNVENAVVTAQSTAEGAADAAAQAQREVDALETEVGGIQTVVAGHTTSIGDHATRIGNLEQADITHANEYTELKGIVSGHTGEIAKKANISDLEATNAKVAGNETAIKVLNETTIPGINAEVANKADKTTLANYHTKDEIAAITGTVAEGKTLVQMIADAQANATYDDTAVKALITAEEERAVAKETELANAIKANGDEITAINAVLNTVDNEDAITSLKELAIWVEEHGEEAAEMLAAIGANADGIAANLEAIEAINDEKTGILAQAQALVDGIPVATAELLGLVKFDDETVKMNKSNQLYVAEVSTDILVQGADVLVLNGGTAAV